MNALSMTAAGAEEISVTAADKTKAKAAPISVLYTPRPDVSRESAGKNRYPHPFMNIASE